MSYTIKIIMPKVWFPSIDDGRIELVKCAARAQVSRGVKTAYNVGSKTIGHHDSDGVIQEFDKAEALISRLLGFKPHPHESVLEHGNLTIDFQISRIATHELVRHRHCAFTQESTRYVGYNKSNIVTFIDPTLGEYVGKYKYSTLFCLEAPKIVDRLFNSYYSYVQNIRYSKLKREQARYLLPGALASNISVTANLRSWRHMVAFRDQKKAAPEMQFIFRKVRQYLTDISPCLVENLEGELNLK